MIVRKYKNEIILDQYWVRKLLVGLQFNNTCKKLAGRLRERVEGREYHFSNCEYIKSFLESQIASKVDSYFC